MSEREERAMAEGLRVLSTMDDPGLSVPLDLADRVERRVRLRRRRQGVATGIAAAVVVATVAFVGGHVAGPTTAQPASPVPATLRTTGTSGPRLIESGRYIGTDRQPSLTVAPPPSGAPLVAESDAVQIFRASGPARSGATAFVSDVHIGYATVTLTGDLRTGDGAWFVNRPAWVVSYVDHDEPCPTPQTGVTLVPGGRVYYLLDANTAARAVTYRPESQCLDVSDARPGPEVAGAWERLSIPWTEVNRDNGVLTVRVEDPYCLQVLGSTFGGGEVTVEGIRLLFGPPCSPVARTLPAGTVTATDVVTHAPTGPVPGIWTRTTGTDFGYDDGR